MQEPPSAYVRQGCDDEVADEQRCRCRPDVAARGPGNAAIAFRESDRERRPGGWPFVWRRSARPGRAGLAPRLTIAFAQIRACAASARRDCFCRRAGAGRPIAMATTRSSRSGATITAAHDRIRPQASAQPPPAARLHAPRSSSRTKADGGYRAAACGHTRSRELHHRAYTREHECRSVSLMGQGAHERLFWRIGARQGPPGDVWRLGGRGRRVAERWAVDAQLIGSGSWPNNGPNVARATSAATGLGA
jgi:hypothetical protein